MFSQLPGVRSAGVSAEDVGSAQDKFKVSLYHGVRGILKNEKLSINIHATYQCGKFQDVLLSKPMLASKDRMQG